MTLRGFEGAPNFRDFGGDPTRDGRRVRLGLLYRSGALGRLTEADRDRLRCLGLRVCVDLRSAKERAASPSAAPFALLGRLLTPNTEAGLHAAGALLARMLRERPDAGGGREVMRLTYRLMPEALASALRQVLMLATDEDGAELPLLVHCTAGKDRTGFIAAMLLLALGVDRERVIDGHLITRERCDLDVLTHAAIESLAASGLIAPPAFAQELAGVRRQDLAASLDAITAAHGSIDAYLQHAVGLDGSRRALLKRRLLHQ